MIALEKIHKILDDLKRNTIQYKLISDHRRQWQAPFWPFVLSVAFRLRLICLLWCWPKKGEKGGKKLMLPKGTRTVRKGSIIIINEFSAHNTFYSLFKWLSSCLWGCCFCWMAGQRVGSILSNWLPHFNEPVKIVGPVMKGGQQCYFM